MSYNTKTFKERAIKKGSFQGKRKRKRIKVTVSKISKY